MTNELNKSPPTKADIGACHHSDCIVWKSDYPICDCGGIEPNSPPQHTPDLELAELILNAHKQGHPIHDDVVNAARATIAKARGQT